MANSVGTSAATWLRGKGIKKLKSFLKESYDDIKVKGIVCILWLAVWSKIFA